MTARRPHRPQTGWFASRIVLMLLLGAATAPGALWREDFSARPTAGAWEVWGDESHFVWDAGAQALEVTWDSSRSNSYLFRPLGTILTKAEDFSFGFDLRLRDIAIGTTPGRPYTFQIALGLVGRRSVTDSNFFRGTGRDAVYGPRNLVEFDYFPDFAGFGATVAPTAVSTNNQIRFSDNHPLELVPGPLYSVLLTYTASNQVLSTVMQRNGAPFGLPPEASLRDLSLAGFADFRIDTFAIASYSDDRQTPEEFSGSILAHGLLDNIRVSTPDPALDRIRGRLAGLAWETEFAAEPGWVYTLERSLDARSWSAVATGSVSVAQTLVMVDNETAPAGTVSRFYRVQGDRP